LQILEENNRKSALVFVHGYANSMKDAAFRLAQIVFDTQYTGQPLLFRWDSAGSTAGYKRDRDSVAIARRPFVEFLDLLQEQPHVEEVHILAHSMGNWLVLDALANFSQPILERPITELIMAHPDVDQDLYKVLVEDVKRFTEGMTLYASSADFPLWFSGLLGGSPVSGAVNADGPLSIPDIDSIDVSALAGGGSILRHGTFAEHRSMVDDIGRLITFGSRPPSQRSPQLRPVPEGAETPRYWRFVD
jgi:esterase/lipase superfamily enzyme